eukprot:5957135-Heterocapsa_arctica.AAC.1
MAEDEVRTLPEGEPFDCFKPQDGPVYTDGSCFEGNWGDAARAGHSAVQIDDEGRLIRAIYAPIPAGCPQNAAFAEHLAAKQAAAHAAKDEPIVVIADCASVVNSAKAGKEYATNYRRPMGGLWRQIDWSALKEVQKVKAHIDLE